MTARSATLASVWGTFGTVTESDIDAVRAEAVQTQPATAFLVDGLVGISPARALMLAGAVLRSCLAAHMPDEKLLTMLVDALVDHRVLDAPVSSLMRLTRPVA